MSKCGQAAQRPLDPSREGGVAVDALLDAVFAPGARCAGAASAALFFFTLFLY